MTSSALRACVLDGYEAASGRLDGIERFTIAVSGSPQSREVRVALPISYRASKTRRHRYPLLVVFEAQACFGSAVEMSRLMSETEEIHDCIVAGIDNVAGDFDHPDGSASWLSAALLAECERRYRVDPAQATLFGIGASGAYALRALLAAGGAWRNAIVCNPRGITPASLDVNLAGERRTRRLVLVSGPDAEEADDAGVITEALRQTAGETLQIHLRTLEDEPQTDIRIPALVSGLQALFATGIAYGRKVERLRRRFMPELLGLLAPLSKRLLPKPGKSPAGNPHRVHASALGRDFEVFACLPASAAGQPARRYPALLVLDANIEFATVAETAARMAAAGSIEEVVVIGLGTPRAEGAMEFGYRRFEEFSPPIDEYAFDDDLGRFFRSVFAMRGEDARQRLGRAPRLLDFISDELMPQLTEALPIDPARLGLLGHSAGGTFVGFALACRPELFRYYAAISPGVGVSGSWLMRQDFDGSSIVDSGASVFLAVGEAELHNVFNRIAGIPATSAFADHLRRQTGLPVRFRCFDGETHSSIYPRAVTQALSSFFAVRMPVS